MIKIVVDNIYSSIVGYLPDEVSKALDKVLSYRIQQARFVPSVRAKRWDGVFRLYNKNRQSFYTGLLSFVRGVLTKYDVDYRMVDRRACPEINMPSLKFTPSKDFEDRDYQNFTIDRAIKFTRGVLQVCTGGGKTMIVTRIIAQLQTGPFIFFVLTKDLMRQAHEQLSECLNEPIGIIGDGMCDIKNVTVCTVQTAIRALHWGHKFKVSDYVFDDEDKWDEKSIENAEKAEKIQKLIQGARGVYFDEAHHVAARICKEVLIAAQNAFWRFGGSATPYRDAGDEIMIQAMFGAKIVNISASYLIRKDFLIRPYILFEEVDSANDFHSWQKVYSTAIVHNDAFNNHVADTAMHLVNRGLSTLVLVKQYPHGDYLKERILGSEFVTSRMSGKKRSEKIQDLRTGRLKCMIATSLADEGLDIPTLGAAILAGGGASVTRTNQRIGRTIRKEKGSTRDKSIVICYDHKKTRFLKKHTKKIKRILKTEEEFVIRDSKGKDFICDEVDDILSIKHSSRATIFDV